MPALSFKVTLWIRQRGGGTWDPEISMNLPWSRRQASCLHTLVGPGAWPSVWAAALTIPLFSQLTQALSGRFNSHVHVEYEWRLLHEDLDESDDDMDEKLQVCARLLTIKSFDQLHPEQCGS